MTPPLPSPVDFTDESDKDEMFLESDYSYVFEITAEAFTAVGERQMEVYRDRADEHQWQALSTFLGEKKNPESIFIGQKKLQAPPSAGWVMKKLTTFFQL